MEETDETQIKYPPLTMEQRLTLFRNILRYLKSGEPYNEKTMDFLLRWCILAPSKTA
jgi:hypothetical protein